MGDAPFHFLLPGPIDQRTGGYLYVKRILDALRHAGAAPGVFEIPAGQEAARAALAEIADGAAVVIDGLGFPLLLPAMPALAARCRTVALVHHPLSLETGLDQGACEHLEQVERAALGLCRGAVVTSSPTAAVLPQFGVDPAGIAVVEPGTDPAPPATGSGGHGVSLLCVATLTPRKGHLTLIEALARLRTLPWTLTCLGARHRDPATAAAVAAAIDRHGLGERVHLAGEADDAMLDLGYRSADVFVLSSHYEGYGMAFAEAMARGLPIVASGAGAVATTVPPEAGLIVPVGDVGALVGALRRVIGDGRVRARLAAGSRAAGLRLPDWPRQARSFCEAVHRLARR